MASPLKRSPLKRKHGDKGIAQPVNSPVKRKRLHRSVPSPQSSSSSETESDSQKSWEVKRIHDQRGDRYLLEWVGVDDKGEPWPLDWVHRDDLTCPDLIEQWEASGFQRHQDLQALRHSQPEPSLRDNTQSLSVRDRGSRVIQDSLTFEIQETLEEDHLSSQTDGAGRSKRQNDKAIGSQVQNSHTQVSQSSKSVNREDSTLGSSVDGSPGLPAISTQVQIEQSSSLELLSQRQLPDVGSIERITSSRSMRFAPSQNQQASPTVPRSTLAGAKDDGPSLLFFNTDDDQELVRERNTIGLGIESPAREADPSILSLTYSHQRPLNSTVSQEIPTSYQPVTQIRSSPVVPSLSADPPLSQQVNSLISSPLPLFASLIESSPSLPPSSTQAPSSSQAPSSTRAPSSTKAVSTAASRLFICSQPSTDIMASNTKLRNQLHALRAGSRAQSSPLSKNASPAPSTPRSPLTRSQRLSSPDKELESGLAAEDQPVPSREPPESPNRPGRDMEVDESRSAPEEIRRVPNISPPDMEADEEFDVLLLPILEPNEHVIPLPIDGRMKDQYLSELFVHGADITAYGQDATSSRLVESMQTMIRTLSDTLIHLDLGLDDTSAEFGVAEQDAGYAEVSSMKFAFLEHLVKMLDGRNCTIAIFARGPSTKPSPGPGQDKRLVTDLIFAYLCGKRASCAYPARSTSSTEGAQKTQYYVVSTGDDLSYLPPDVSGIISFDDSLKVADLPNRVSRLPVLLPWVVYSPEHIARCIPPDVEPSEKLRRQVEVILDHRASLGEWEPAELASVDPIARSALMKREFLYRVENAAATVVNAMSTNSFGKALFEVPQLEMTYPKRPPSTPTAEPVSRADTPGQKRLREDPASDSQAKRQRLTPLADVSHISDSMKGTQSPSQQAMLKTSQTALANERAAHQQTQATLDQLVLDHRSLQHRYEKRRRDAHANAKLHREQTATLENLQTRHKTLQDSHNTIKDALRTTTTNLAAARADLIASDNPEKAALATAREEARLAQTESETLQSRIKSRGNDFEFLREQYQSASTAAAENGIKVTELEAELAQLRTDLDPPMGDDKNPPFLSSRSDFTALSASSARNTDLARVEQLEIELATMRTVWEKAEEEVLVLRRMRGGVVTRGGSVQPQFATVGSRGGSPMTGIGIGGNGNGNGIGVGAGNGGGGGGQGWRPTALREER